MCVKQELLPSLNKSSLGVFLPHFLSFPFLDCSRILGRLCQQSSICHKQETVTFECCDGGLWVVLGSVWNSCELCPGCPGQVLDSGILLSRLVDAPTFPYFQLLEGTWTPGYQTCPTWVFIALEAACNGSGYPGSVRRCSEIRVYSWGVSLG